MSYTLITGATGFVGQRLVRCLKEYGHNLRILSRSPVLGVDIIACDFVEDDIPEIALYDVDTVFHVAGYAHDLRNESILENIYRRVNVDVTVRLLSLSIKYNVKHFVFVSSVKAGGVAIPSRHMTEDDQNEPDGFYGQTKREAELAVLEAGQKSSMHVSIIRPSLVYGARVKGNFQMMLSGVKHGWFLPLPDTGNCRSMIHVDDLVEAMLLVSMESKANGEIFIATDGVGYSTHDIYIAMLEAMGRRAPKWFLPKFIFSIASLTSRHIADKVDKLFSDACYSSEKLKSIGFIPRSTLYTALPEMVRSLYSDELSK